MKYKVGDRVIIEESNIEYCSVYKGLEGTIVEVDAFYKNHPYRVSTAKCPGGVWCKVRCLVNNAPHKIVITTDGKTTTARLFNGKELIRKAEAKCSPDDKFDFMVGAKLAMERLEGEEPKKPKNPFKVGDYVRITGDKTLGHCLPVGSVGRVVKTDDDSCNVAGFWDSGSGRIEQHVGIEELEKI